jgi:hypothetical protein
VPYGAAKTGRAISRSEVGRFAKDMADLDSSRAADGVRSHAGCRRGRAAAVAAVGSGFPKPADAAA